MRKFSSLFAVVVSLTLLNCATSAPDRPELKKESPKEKPIPQIAGPSSWGIVGQDNRKIVINGDENWHVQTGEIRKDGKLFLIWISNSSGKLAPGLYTINPDGSITGVWNWGEETSLDDDGTWHGLTLSDTLRVKPLEK